jgi:hypothetical protein
MARITNFIYCMSANTSDIEANALGILSAITPEYVPGSFSFSVLCSIVDIENGTHNIAMKFLNPSGDILVNIDCSVPYEKISETNLPNEYLGINISSNWQNVVLKESGLYKTVVNVDGEECGTYEIYVKGKNEEA